MGLGCLYWVAPTPRPVSGEKTAGQHTFQSQKAVVDVLSVGKKVFHVSRVGPHQASRFVPPLFARWRIFPIMQYVFVKFNAS